MPYLNRAKNCASFKNCPHCSVGPSEVSPNDPKWIQNVLDSALACQSTCISCVCVSNCWSQGHPWGRRAEEIDETRKNRDFLGPVGPSERPKMHPKCTDECSHKSQDMYLVCVWVIVGQRATLGVAPLRKLTKPWKNVIFGARRTLRSESERSKMDPKCTDECSSMSQDMYFVCVWVIVGKRTTLGVAALRKLMKLWKIVIFGSRRTLRTTQNGSRMYWWVLPHVPGHVFHVSRGIYGLIGPHRGPQGSSGGEKWQNP